MAVEASEHVELQGKARDHLWLHFADMSSYRTADIPVMERGEGPYLFDTQGRRYLDFLAGLFTVQIGYSHGEELGQVAAEQMARLPFYTNWTYAHPPAIELADRLAELTPEGLSTLVLRLGRLGGRGGGVEDRPPVPPAPRRASPAEGHRPEHRLPRHHHGGALITGITASAARSSPWSRACGTWPTRTATAASTARPEASARWRAPTRSPRRSSSRAPRRWPWSSWSPSRTPAGASRPTPTTTGACARSATTTASSRSPTRSSAGSGGWASGSAPCATTTGPTS